MFNRTLEDNSHSAVYFHFTSVIINQLEMCLLWPLKGLNFTHPELIKNVINFDTKLSLGFLNTNSLLEYKNLSLPGFLKHYKSFTKIIEFLHCQVSSDCL